MATILSIETSNKVCSVALTKEGFILSHKEDFSGPNHSSLLSQFIIDCMDYLRQHDNMQLDAVAVSIGPGSYTGLRIGLSEAKGLCYGLKIPLIGINTLKIMAVEMMFALDDFDPATDILIPMIDARRDEVYLAAFNGMLDYALEPINRILEPCSFQSEFPDKRLIFGGNGIEKLKRIVNLELSDHKILSDIYPLATSMLPLAEQAYRNNNFCDIAYSTPFYLKDFQATKPKRGLKKG